MLRSCYIFRFKAPAQVTEDSLERVRTMNFHALSGSLTTRREQNLLDGLAERVSREWFESYQLGDQRADLSFSCYMKLIPPSVAAATTRARNVQIRFPVWLRRYDPFMSVFAPQKGIALGVAWLVSKGFFNDHTQVRSYRLGHQHLSEFESWLGREDHPTQGSILRATFEGVQWQDELYDEITIRRDALRDTELFSSLKTKSKNWKSLTFISPLLADLDRQLTCRIDSSGKFTVFTPTVTPLEFDVMLQRLEQVLSLMEEIEDIMRKKGEP